LLEVRYATRAVPEACDVLFFERIRLRFLGGFGRCVVGFGLRFPLGVPWGGIRGGARLHPVGTRLLGGDFGEQSLGAGLNYLWSHLGFGGGEVGLDPEKKFLV